MSSHHIVRENQEPALLIANARAISFEKIQELLEWMPIVVVLYTEVEEVIAWGIKIDVVIVPALDIDKWNDRLMDQLPVRIISFDPEDDPIAAGVLFLNSIKATAINCLLNASSELAGFDPSLPLDIEAFIENTLWRFIRKGNYEKWLPAETALLLYPVEMSNEFDAFVSGQYVTSEDGIVRFKSQQPFWIGEKMTN